MLQRSSRNFPDLIGAKLHDAEWWISWCIETANDVDTIFGLLDDDHQYT